jgi:hypothetical protein
MEFPEVLSGTIKPLPPEVFKFNTKAPCAILLCEKAAPNFSF